MDTQFGAGSEPDERRLLDELVQAFNAHDVERIVTLHTPDAVWEDPSLGAPIVGRDAIRTHLMAIFRAFPDFTFEDGSEIYHGDHGHAALHWRFSATMTGEFAAPHLAPTGKHASIAGMCVYGFDQGLIARHQQYYDLVELLEEIGLLPAPDSAPVKLAAGIQRASVLVSRSLRRAS